MKITHKNVLITGGYGFIGSYLVEALLKKNNFVTVIDNLSAGSLENINIKDKRLKIFIEDILDFNLIKKLVKGQEIIFHFAAQPDVRKSYKQILGDFAVNVLATIYILEAMKENNVKFLIFASSAGTIYGDNPVFPTPENEPFYPISHYGATKAACEMFLSSYSHLHNIKCISLRYGNIFGPRSNHGVIFDFFHKLKKNPKVLEILGDGKQEKSYLYIDDCINASFLASEKAKSHFDFFNISSEETILVKDIAKIVLDELNLKKVKFSYTGGKRGWPGDVVKTRADVSKIKKLGFKPKVTLQEGIRKYVRWLKEKYR